MAKLWMAEAVDGLAASPMISHRRCAFSRKLVLGASP